MSGFSVYIIEPNVLTRHMVCSVLKNTGMVSDIRWASLGDESSVMSDLNNVKPDLLFLGFGEENSLYMKLFLKIRKAKPDIPVVLLTPLTRRGAKIAFWGLMRGAVEYVTKPERRIDVVLASRHFYKRVVPLVMAAKRLNPHSMIMAQNVFPHKQVIGNAAEQIGPGMAQGTLTIVAGCLGAMRSAYQLVSQLPSDFRGPVVLVLHMPKLYTAQFAEELDKVTHLNVYEAEDQQPLKEGTLYLAPGGHHTMVQSNGYEYVLAVHRGPRQQKNRPSIDLLMHSAASHFREKVLAIYLSGGGNDGIRGARDIVSSGGEILIESKKSSLLWDLPGTIDRHNLSTSSHDADSLSEEIIKRKSHDELALNQNGGKLS